MPAIHTALILAGALLYRWRGMAHPYKKYFPRPFNQIAFALPFAYVTYADFVVTLGSDYALVPAFIVLTLTTLGVLTGHGRGLDLGDTDKGEPETLEFTIAWLKPYIPLKFYDMILLSVTGLAVTLPAGLATLNPVLALSGLLKGPAYVIGRFGCERDRAEAGELLTGAVLWGAVLIC